MSNSIRNVFIFLALIFISYKLHKKEINDFPQHIHAWAQSDYYAISLGFIDNGFDFFHPQTFALNKQFPDNFSTPSETGITAVDFPIHTYNVGLLMTVLKTESPWVFRVYTLCYSIVGLFALFLLIKAIDGSDVKGGFVVLVVLFSPVYLYYRAGFLPTIPSISNTIIGYLFYVQYLKSKQLKQLSIALIFFTLASLARTPFAIFLIGVVCQEGLLMLMNKKVNYKILVRFLLSFSFIGGYFIYNSLIRTKYGTIFLSTPLTPDSWEEAKESFLIALGTWKWHYLTKWHYLIVLGGVVLSIVQFLNSKKISKIHTALFLQFGIVLIGALLYSFLMLNQFKQHDYYFLDSFFIPIVLFLSLTFSYIRFDKIYITILVFVFLCFATKEIVRHSLDAQIQRTQSGLWGALEITTQNYTDAASLLTQLNIKKDAKLLVLDSEVPNIPFILLRRYGYTVHPTIQHKINTLLDWDFDYAVMQDHNVQKLVSICPALSFRLERVGGNNAVSIYRKLKKPIPKSILELLALNVKKPLYTNSIVMDKDWRRTVILKDSSYIISASQEFGASLKIASNEQILNQNNLILIELLINKKDLNKEELLVVNVSDNKNSYFYQIKMIKKGVNQFIFTTPALLQNNNTLKIYIWNKEQDEIAIQDFEIKIY